MKMGNVCKKMGSSRTRTIKEEKEMEQKDWCT
jgi:hypothetical protein